jgi:hypothetical protein
VLRVGRVVVCISMDDPTKYTTFKWSSTDRKLAKAVKTRVGDLMREARSCHKTSVLWHEVQFVQTGVVVPFKKPSSHRTTWGWFYRTLLPVITKMQGSRDSWVWEAVESEMPTDGASTSPPTRSRSRRARPRARGRWSEGPEPKSKDEASSFSRRALH